MADRPEAIAEDDRLHESVAAEVTTRVLGPDEPLLGGEYPSGLFELHTYRNDAGEVVEEARACPEADRFLRHLEDHGAGPADDPNGKRVRAELRSASQEMRRFVFDELRRTMVRVGLRKPSVDWAAMRARIVTSWRPRPRAARGRRRTRAPSARGRARPEPGDDDPDPAGELNDAPLGGAP